jgi:ATP-dependent RNA helicase DeaD
MEDAGTFADLGLKRELLTALTELGYEEPTPIQRAAIPPLLEGRDLLGQAATGTGKTAAFALPILQGLSPRRKETAPLAVVLVPTRELAMQVAEALHRYGRKIGVRVLPIYGGQPIVRQLRALERGVDVVVATPGRALDHLRRRTLRLEEIRTVVLDEADEMLDMGFAEDIEAILDQAPEGRQTVLFSATLPTRIRAIARRHLKDPAQIEIARKPVEAGQLPQVRQTAYVVPRPHKLSALIRILDVEAPAAAIVFCRTRNEVETLADALGGRGFRAEALHGGLTQEQRDKVMRKVRGGKAEILVATDVAARGLDVERLTHVLNYDAPSAPEAYVHRIGRVGRAGREGVAITLAEPREHRLLKNIERLTRRKIHVEKVPTVADLQSRRLELTRAALKETLLAGELERFRVVVESLAEESELFEVALAAVKLAHEASGAEVEAVEIPEASPPKATPPKARPRREATRGAKGGAAKGRPTREQASAAPGRDGRPKKPGGRKSAGMTRIFVGAGREAGVRPQDLVGAITGEAGVTSREIGAIEITDRFALVEIADDVVPKVIDGMRRARLKGRKVTVRREKF